MIEPSIIIAGNNGFKLSGSMMLIYCKNCALFPKLYAAIILGLLGASSFCIHHSGLCIQPSG